MDGKRYKVLLEAKNSKGGLIYMIQHIGMSDDELERRQNIWLLSDEGHLEKISRDAYRLTAKGEAYIKEEEALEREATAIQMTAEPSALKRFFKAHGGKAWALVLAALAALRSCG